MMNESPSTNHDDLSLRGLQAAVDAWIGQFEEGYFPPLANLARLSEEVGELARVVSHHEGFKKPKAGEAMGSVEEELADILFVLVCLANPLGIDLEVAARKMLDKIERRDRTRWTLKEDAARAPGDGDGDKDPA